MDRLFLTGIASLFIFVYPMEVFCESVGSGSRTVVPIAESARARQIVTSLAKAYPGRIAETDYRNGDWALRIEDRWYSYARGRILPEKIRDAAESYDAQPFYSYPAELPAWQPPTAEEAEELRTLKDRRQTSPPRRYNGFYDDLWRSHDRSEAYDRQKTIRFLGKSLLVHYSILEELALVEERILLASRRDASVRRWIANLDTATGWNWRPIADAASRSYHSYGAAIDLLPKSYRYATTYWLWSAENGVEWWNIPYEKRLNPPQAVIKAFESQGFVWGGKWKMYDTMHFEYRPEILILNGIEVEGLPQ